jgi:hypothetical protein
VVLLEFKDPAKTVPVARYAASGSAPKAYGYAIELACPLRTSFIDKAGFRPRVTLWTDLDKRMPRDGRKRPFPASPAGSRMALSGQAPERRIGFPAAGRRRLAIIPAAFCALVMIFGLAGLFGVIDLHRQRLDILDYEVQVWWVAPLAFAALGGLGLVATVLGVGARFEIRETAASLVFIKRLFGRPWRVTEMPKSAVIVIEHRLDPSGCAAAGTRY